MRLLILVTSILLTTSALFSQKNYNKFRLKGKVIGQDTGYVHLQYFNNLTKYVSDSCYLKNGEFEFTGFIDGTTRATFYGNRKSRSVDDPNWMEMFIEPGNLNALFRVDEFKKAQINGSKSQNEFAIYNRRIDGLNNKWKNVFEELNNAKIRKDSIKEDEIYNEQLPLYRSENNSIRLNFIKEFPSSDISAYLLFNQVNLSLDSVKYYYSLLTPLVQHSFYGSNIDSSIIKQEKLQIGMPAPDFILTDLNGKEVSLKNFKGKYILLDFWASWCVPCREENPYLKNAYAKYHKGFEIIGFSLDGPENKDAWIKAIKKDGLPWIQLCDFKVWNSEVLSKYNYLGGKGIPASFLINPEGLIIAKNLRGDEIEAKLKELIK